MNEDQIDLKDSINAEIYRKGRNLNDEEIVEVLRFLIE